MHLLQLTADELVGKLLNLPAAANLCLLDSCGVSHLGSHFLLAGIYPSEKIELKFDDFKVTFQELEKKLAQSGIFAFLTFSYDFGMKINQVSSRHINKIEPDIFIAMFEVLIVHDYNSKQTYLLGNENKFNDIENQLRNIKSETTFIDVEKSKATANFKRLEYLSVVENIKEYIRQGYTYQTNLTQQIRVALPSQISPELVFNNLRKTHPAPFAAFFRRNNDVVISASPERFLQVEGEKISTSPIKGTRPRGKNALEDDLLKEELLNSAKDRAENVMIVDLLRNDLGRICQFGSVIVEKLCDLEEHSTLFHLVSTINGKLKEGVSISQILAATFPCGSITGAPKIRTMQIIDEVETASRGLSMGAIGFFSSTKNFNNHLTSESFYLDLSVAIRTMVIRNNEAIFNVGGGIVIDSLPTDEYDETLVKAKAILDSLNSESFF